MFALMTHMNRNAPIAPRLTAAVALPAPRNDRLNVVMQDLSRSGAALRHRVPVQAGRDVEIVLPKPGGPVTGHVIRSSGGVLEVNFNNTPAMLARVDKALASLTIARAAA